MEEIIEVQILDEGVTAKEVNNKTNAKMGVRHVNYESMLRFFKITKIAIPNGEEILVDKFTKEQYGHSIKIGGKYKAKILENQSDAIIIL